MLKCSMKGFTSIWGAYFTVAVLIFQPRNFQCFIVCREDEGNDCNATLNVCYIHRELIFNHSIRVTQGCYNFEVGLDEFCAIQQPNNKIYCCHTDYCNLDTPTNVELLLKVELDRLMVTPPTSPPPSPVTPSPLLGVRNTAIIIVLPTVCILCISLLIFVCLCVKKWRHCCCKHESHIAEQEPTIGFVDTSDTSISSGSGSGLPVLVQRTVARCIKLDRIIGNGRFGQVFVGVYQKEMIAVKKFSTRDELSWFRESEIYNKFCLRHDNILVFFASDMFSNNGCTELWLITQYHPHSSLYDYLSSHTLHSNASVRMALSICRGLTHLHTPVYGTSSKPAIAHRDVKSKNILVKDNLECCISDFGLSVIQGDMSTYPINAKQGSTRYMAPEILKGTIDLSRFESLVEADVYALGLVLWELCSRCESQLSDLQAEYVPPFHGLVPSDPSLECMLKVVVEKGMQPTIPASWWRDKLLSTVSGVMRECWYHNGQARPSTIAIKHKLLDLRPLHSDNETLTQGDLNFRKVSV